MRGYLLDNNHIEAFFRKEPKIIQKIRTIPADHLLWVCSITFGEIIAGHQMTQTTNQVRRDEYTKFVNENFIEFVLEVSEHTGEYYGNIMGRIFQSHPPSNTKIKTDQHLLNLGVDINDAWAVAVAWEHGLTFVTEDKMACIREAVVNDVIFENWLL